MLPRLVDCHWYVVVALIYFVKCSRSPLARCSPFVVELPLKNLSSCEMYIQCNQILNWKNLSCVEIHCELCRSYEPNSRKFGYGRTCNVHVEELESEYDLLASVKWNFDLGTHDQILPRVIFTFFLDLTLFFWSTAHFITGRGKGSTFISEREAPSQMEIN